MLPELTEQMMDCWRQRLAKTPPYKVQAWVDQIRLDSGIRSRARVLLLAPEAKARRQFNGEWAVFDGEGRALSPMCPTRPMAWDLATAVLNNLVVRLKWRPTLCSAGKAMTLDDVIEYLQALRDRHGGNVSMMLGQAHPDSDKLWSGIEITPEMIMESITEACFNRAHGSERKSGWIWFKVPDGGIKHRSLVRIPPQKSS